MRKNTLNEKLAIVICQHHGIQIECCLVNQSQIETYTNSVFTDSGDVFDFNTFFYKVAKSED